MSDNLSVRKIILWLSDYVWGFSRSHLDTAPPIETEFKEMDMDMKNHFAKRLLSVLCIVSSCALFCMLAGCEEELMTQSDNTIEHEHETQAGLDGIAEAARQARAALDEKFSIPSIGMTSDKPYAVSEEEVAKAVEDIAVVEKPIVQPVILTQEPVAVAAVETVVITPVNSVEDLIAANPEEDEVNTEEEAVIAEEAFIADEKEAIAVLAQDIDLKIPTPAENAELLKETKISVPNLDNMHIATAPLVSDNGKEDLEKPEESEIIPEESAEAVDTEAITEPITEAETVQPVEEDASKGFFRKIGSTVGNAVGKFTARHYFILGAAMAFVIALIYLRNKKMVSFTPWRKK